MMLARKMKKMMIKKKFRKDLQPGGQHIGHTAREEREKADSALEDDSIRFD